MTEAFSQNIIKLKRTIFSVNTVHVQWIKNVLL